MSQHLQNLKQAVRTQHGCECVPSGGSRVIEHFDGGRVFDGDVETFTLIGHRTAVEAYAFVLTEENLQRVFTVLKVLPIWDASDAVRAAFAAG